MGRTSTSKTSEVNAPESSSSKKTPQKKLYWYSSFGIIELQEQLFRQGKGKPLVRPFCQSAGVSCRRYSIPLQRIITDLGADIPFGRIPQKLQEHYGITVPVSSAQKITQDHAARVLQQHQTQTQIPTSMGVKQLIVEMDGSMIPIVSTESTTTPDQKIDRRKTRTVGWREARLCLARDSGSSQPTFGVTLGSVDAAVKQLADIAIRAGLGSETLVHGVGDGAPWIANQVKRMFGDQANYLIDFYHLCDYLADASTRCAPHNPQSWLQQQKQRLKHNQVQTVLMSLKPDLEPENLRDEQAPVRVCYRYLMNRPGQFNYQDAIQGDLPIGSGEIESAHGYVIQERLKLSGCWWKLENAMTMLALRVLRANQDWDSYWLQTQVAIA